MNNEEILQKLTTLIDELESLANEADGDNPNRELILEIDSAITHLKRARAECTN